MVGDTRPDPDRLLAVVQHEEERQRRGRLKIFFGSVAGVGKTYAMLEAARARQLEGLDVVVGYVETHGRAETEALLAGLTVVPRKKIEYRGKIIDEMDLDAILARRPQLALVDELAHTNVTGSRHPKRYQDVLELLEAGIDVFTTINVQHLESRADTVQQITGTPVRETVPDSIVEQAAEIELVDLPPEELLKRLAEGKVYAGEQAELATRNFFRLGNLTALREMALRLTAERVDHQLQDYMQVKHIAGPWKSGERLMVAVSADASSERLVRWTRRMAYSLEAQWLAVYVETPRELSEGEKARLAHVLALARELGAEVVTTSDVDVPRALIRVAQQRNVTQIVIGKPKRSLLRHYLGSAQLANQIIRQSGDVDIYVVTGEKSAAETKPAPLRLRELTHWQYYAITLLVVVLTTLFNLAVLPLVGYRAVALVYIFVVSTLALFTDRGPVLLAAAISAIAWNFLFIPPRFTFTISALDDILMFAMYFAVALITGTLTSRLRDQERVVRHREERATAMYALARNVASAITMQDVLATAVKQIGQAFNADIAFLLKGAADQLQDVPHPTSSLTLTEKELSVARLAYEKKRLTGRDTDTLPMSEAQWIPLRASNEVVGVMGVRSRDNQHLSADQQMLLETFAGQVSLAIERERMDEAAEHTRIVVESERLHKTLLNSVSHELRTPIATISGAASALLDDKINSNRERWTAVVHEMQIATERLNRVVENLLGMTRLESGRLQARLEWCDVSDLISVSVNRLRDELAQHDLIVDVAPDLPLIRIDFMMMEQALLNLLHNAVAHTPPGTRIRITARVDGADLMLSVADRGPGLPPADLDRVFDKFYRAPNAKPGGIGLGLSITKGLVEAQGATIRAENRANGGARFIMRFPLGAAPAMPHEGVT